MSPDCEERREEPQLRGAPSLKGKPRPRVLPIWMLPEVREPTTSPPGRSLPAPIQASMTACRIVTNCVSNLPRHVLAKGDCCCSGPLRPCQLLQVGGGPQLLLRAVGLDSVHPAALSKKVRRVLLPAEAFFATPGWLLQHGCRHRASCP